MHGEIRKMHFVDCFFIVILNMWATMNSKVKSIVVILFGVASLRSLLLLLLLLLFAAV